MGTYHLETSLPLLKQSSIMHSGQSMPKSNTSQNSKVGMIRKAITDKINSAIEKLIEMEKEKMALLELEYQNSLMAIPTDVLNTVIDINDERFRAFILGMEDVSDVKDQQSPPKVSSTECRRRSRSANSIIAGQRINSKIRSTSVDIYKSPRGGIRISTIMSNKKYTVTKPKRIENSGLHVKRIMKPDEEAISTRGSPLHVGPGNLHAPHVNIPLPGGVVLNIEPITPKGPLEEIAGLDPKTKNQIKLLCEQLQKLC